MSDDFFIRLERQLQAAELRELNRAPALRRLVSARRLLSVPLAAAAAVGVVVVVLAVLGAIDNNDADRRPQPVGTVPAPSKKAVADATTSSAACASSSTDGYSRCSCFQIGSTDLRSGRRRADQRDLRPKSPRRRVIRGARPRSPGAGRTARRA